MLTYLFQMHYSKLMTEKSIGTKVRRRRKRNLPSAITINASMVAQWKKQVLCFLFQNSLYKMRNIFPFKEADKCQRRKELQYAKINNLKKRILQSTLFTQSYFPYYKETVYSLLRMAFNLLTFNISSHQLMCMNSRV